MRFLLADVCGISATFVALSPTGGQVPTCYSAVRHSPAEAGAFDLHALGTPPAFVLSQDQTRHRMGGADFAPRERPTRWMSRFSCQGACGRREAIKNQAVRLAVRPTWRQWVDSPVASSFGASRSRRSSLLWVRRITFVQKSIPHSLELVKPGFSSSASLEHCHSTAFLVAGNTITRH